MNQLTENQKHDFCQSALEKKKELEWNYLELGAMLHRIKNEQLFEAGWSSWEEYAMEFRMSVSSISRLMRVYDVFVLKYGFAPAQLSEAGGWSNLADLLPLLNKDSSPDRAAELVQLASSHTRENLRREIKEAATGEICPHTSTHKITLEICDDCNDQWRVS